MKNYMLTQDGEARKGDIVIDLSYKNQEVEITGFADDGVFEWVMFNIGQPIHARGRSAWRDYKIKANKLKGE